MALKDLPAVLSRQFLIGYFLPVIAALAVLRATLSDRLVPAAAGDAHGTRLALILGGASVGIGLLLEGLQHPIRTVYSGRAPWAAYPFTRAGAHGRPAGWLARLVRKPQERAFDALELSGDHTIREIRLGAAKADIRPTRFGSARRGAEHYVRTRYGFRSFGHTLWPRVDMLLNEREVELHRDAETRVALFVNGSLGAYVIGGLIVLDSIISCDAPGSTLLGSIGLYLAPFVAGWFIYRMALAPAEYAATLERASVDLHLRDVFQAILGEAAASDDDAVRALWRARRAEDADRDASR